MAEFASGPAVPSDLSIPPVATIAAPIAQLRALFILRGLATLGFSFALAALTIVLVEWAARGTLADVGSYIVSMSRPGAVIVSMLFLLYLALDAVLGRAHQSAVVLMPLAIIPALLSGQKQLFLSDPLYPSDLLFGRQMIELMPVMIAARPLAFALTLLGSVIAVVALVFFWRLASRRCREIPTLSKLARLVIAIPALGFFVSLLDYAQYSPLRDRLNILPMMWDQTENYRHNGFLLAFAMNVPMAAVAAPAGYDLQAIQAMAADPSAPLFATGRSPDVIMVMSESLWDPTRLDHVTLTPDPMPTVHAHLSGGMFSPEFGGMTANVEFEALTGFSNAFLPYGSIPYQQYIRRPMPSLAGFFRSKGYVAKAFHPFQNWFWNRKSVYNALGFESFQSEEKLPPMEKRGIFASDEALTAEIIRQADATKDPFFFFAVTLQGHGPYEANRYTKNSITVAAPSLSGRSMETLATYAQGVRESDDSLKALMAWAKTRKRETIIVLFGDHLPPLGSVYPESGYMADEVATRKAAPRIMKRQHETPLVVWSSRSGTQKDLGSISPSQLPYHIVRMAGFRHPFYTGVLGDVQDHYSVVDRYQLIDRQDRGHPDWSRAAQIDPLIRDYQLLQYDQIFGDGFASERFFPEQQNIQHPQS